MPTTTIPQPIRTIYQIQKISTHTRQIARPPKAQETQPPIAEIPRQRQNETQSQTSTHRNVPPRPSDLQIRDTHPSVQHALSDLTCTLSHLTCTREAREAPLQFHSKDKGGCAVFLCSLPNTPPPQRTQSLKSIRTAAIANRQQQKQHEKK